MTRSTLFSVDYEGAYGSPYADAPYDLSGTTERLLSVLVRHRVRAVFFVVGRLVLDRPDLVTTIASHGHEIGLHGLEHEHFDRLSPVELSAAMHAMETVLDSAESATGRRPVGFRCPHLMGPAHYSEAVYSALDRLGIRWVSNREIRCPEELFRPDRLHTSTPWQLVRDRGIPFYSPILLALNATSLVAELRRAHLARPARWLRAGAPPFPRGRIDEYPLTSPLDCDLVGLPFPDKDSATELLDYARWAIAHRARNASELFVLSFHEWIIGTGNRLELLDAVLGDLDRGDPIRWVQPGLQDRRSSVEMR